MVIVIIVAVILLVLAVSVILFYFQKQNNTIINQLTQQLDQFKQQNLDETIDQISDTKLSGETLHDFNQKKEHYFDITEKQLPQIQNQIIDFSEKNANFKILSVYHGLKPLQQQINQIQQILEQLQKKLNSLLEHIQKNQTDFDNIAIKAQKLAAKLQSNAAHYQKAFEPLRTQLTALTKDLSDISTLVTSGDALKAHQLLEDKQVQLSKFQTKAEQILERSINLETDFKTELQELQTAEQRLKVSGINLENPQIATELVEITQKINTLRKLLTDLNVAEFDQLKQKVIEQIDYLYERIAREWRAQKKVEKYQLVLADFIQHAQRQNRLLRQNIRRLSGTYVIKQSDQELALSCQQKIQKISQNYQALIKNIKSQEAIYSKIWQEFKQSAQQLTEIENQQKQIEDGFDGLQQGRNIGIDNLQQITQDLRQLKHQVEVLRLQGLPQDYRDNYYMVNTEAAQLAELLESIPIDVEEVTKQMFVAQEDLSNLKQQAQQLLADVQITNHLIQYANRYIDKYPNVQQAANKAQDLYDNQFDYKQARQIISQALEQVEPGAVKRIRDLYYAEYHKQQ